MKTYKKYCVIIIGVLLCLYCIAGVFAIQNKEKRIPIIGYHHIVSDEDKETYYKHNMWTASQSSFEAQIKLLHDEGYQSVTLDELYEWKQGNVEWNDKRIVITFDDGFYSSTAIAQPILEKYGFTGAVFVIGSQIDNDHGAYRGDIRQHASLEDMRDERVVSYYSHSYDLHHKKQGTYKIDTRTKNQLIRDTEKEQKLVSTKYYAYPYGKYNDLIKDVLKEHGTKLAFGFNENRKAKRSDDDYALQRFCVNAYTKLDVFKTMLESR